MDVCLFYWDIKIGMKIHFKKIPHFFKKAFVTELELRMYIYTHGLYVGVYVLIFFLNSSTHTYMLNWNL